MCIKYVSVSVAILTICYGSHFRGATFSWKPTDNLNEVEISYRVSWTRSRSFCDQTTISSGTLISTGDEMKCFVNCNGTMGVLFFKCTDFSVTEDWTTGRGSIVYKFPSSNSYYEFGFQGGAWISLVHAGNGNWEMRVKANLAPRADTGRVNSAPQFDISPIVRLSYGCQHKIRIPFSDLDGDEVRCRWAESAQQECASICNGFVGAVLDQSTCTLTYNANASSGYYAVAIQMEDFTPGSTTPLSSVPIQFLVNVYSISHVCNSVPEFLPPTRPDGDIVTVDPSGTYTDRIVAKGRASSGNINEIMTLSPSGFSKSVLAPDQSVPGAWYIDVTWNPPLKFSDQTYVFCFSATDTNSLTGEMRCVNIKAIGDINECDSFPCQNGGNCTNTLGSFICHCQTGFTGQICLDDVNECDFDPCENGGNCTNEYGSYFCNCTLGWTGENCSFDINECDFDPCENGGNCTNEYGSYLCNCTLGWTGKNCSVDIDECAHNPCDHGKCSNTNTAGSYSCYCQIGWRGKNCADVQLELILPLILLLLAILALLIFALIRRRRKRRAAKVSDSTPTLNTEIPSELNVEGWMNGSMGVSSQAPLITLLVFKKSFLPE
ncbi:hypothetical protein ACJMK2_027926 [Sinanodonta woodiana]|uniref:EGF-like domain-containing protein n=1 Tax=Sinanodonta woodiana TaxID=1069815 RepID=A0ABD3X5G7_SINWO